MSLLSELYRKSIHLISLWIPILYYYTDKKTSFLVYFILLIILLLFEYIRLGNNSNKIKSILDIIIKFLRIDKIFREHELHHISGATYMLISAAICVLLVEKEIFILAFSILIISDSLAALIGKLIGKHKILLNKTLEGTMAFFISSLIIMVYVGQLFELKGFFIINGIIICFLATTVELLSCVIDVDDNISIPMSICMYSIVFN